jgi:hypothetical protein
MKEVRDATAKILDGTSLASLHRQVQQATPVDPSAMIVISPDAPAPQQL